MNGALYRLEARRLVRTHTLLGLVLLCALCGAVGPVMAYFTEDILAVAGAGAGAGPVLEIPEVTATDALGTYLELAAPFGVLALVLTASSALAFDATPGRSVFHRTRVSGAADLVLPRFALPTAAAVTAFLAGAVSAWAVTSLLFGPLPLVPTLVGALVATPYLALVVAVVALVSMLTRTVLATVGFSAGALVAGVLLGRIPALAMWSPSRLFQGQPALTAGDPVSEFGPMAAVTVLLTALCLALSGLLCGRREV